MRFTLFAVFGLVVAALGSGGTSAAVLNNDLIANAEVVLQAPVTYTFDTSDYNAIPDPDDPPVECAPYAYGLEQQTHTAWFTFVPITSGEFRASTEGTTEVWTVLALWEPSDGGDLIEPPLECNAESKRLSPLPATYSDIPASPTEQGPTLEAGQRYYLEVMSRGATAGGEITLSISYSGLFSPRPVPVITGMAPGGAPTGSTALEVVINGTGLGDATAVQFGTTSLVPSAAGPGSLTVTVPAGLLAAEADIDVTLTNPAPGGGTSQPAAFVVYPEPNIVAMAPTSVFAGSTGATVDIVGSGFREGISTATVGGISRAMNVTGATTAEIALLDADFVSPGTLQIVVTNAAGGGAPVSSAPALLLVRDPLDVNCSGDVTSEDAHHLLRVAAGFAQALPGCPLAPEPGEMLIAVLNIRRNVAGLDRLVER